ncbi:MAG TPA: molybdopterin converting factor subunit 1 [Ottowia sp.]|uniref:molybdopterin converting factor subunit 1 n=1 Tax=Ottowia sp. TaxID=1898956 RepID=UPI002C351988|nr:molybdopterin converting factor subunit 1 [Ottowia sp.]HMN21534.1 molybdopterin converting factor subunit 1 [Ottowia sp.]
MTAPAPIRIRVRYFAALREALGQGSEELRTRAATPAALRQELAARGGAYAEALAPQRAVRMALDQVMARGDEALTEGVEVAFFPPVTGG